MTDRFAGTREATPEQREAARHLIAKAKHLKDAEDEAAFAEVWARDARLAITSNGTSAPVIEGRDAIMVFYRRNWANGAHGAGDERETHVGENPFVVAFGDDRLLATHTAIFAARRGPMPRLIGFGEFRDEIIFEDGAWRIADRRSSLRRRARRSA
ncbi:nuclear transport factor 2 family protein [Rhizorhabdus wittichii]|uniref:Nuclear transport factor 2 family protein n=1 Tax=Rhizorhabdus wittichii TaxID=160791 RepID=A0A975D3T0_9SPHN|nr:nuclear transport factor 2 family protein [Rhizorhabdus wittichii]QTH21145.1 nuclear transport factor 2 family protein [Rhizorhabdus wittichii]